jgi:hypothetical protein
MRKGLVLVCLYSAVVAASGRNDATPAMLMPRLRAETAEPQRLIAMGLAGSPTFRRLVDRLNQSDLIVYITVRPDMPESMGGMMRFLVSTPTCRFVLVSLNARQSRPMLVALLGHELQHVAEVADAPEVHDETALRELYRRIGVRVRVDAYDSVAAQQAGQAVRSELHRQSGEVPTFARDASPGNRTLEDQLLRGASIELSNP